MSHVSVWEAEGRYCGHAEAWTAWRLFIILTLTNKWIFPQTFHLMPFECHFLVALMTLAGQTDARTWARGSLPDVFIRFSQRPLGQAAIPLTLTCGCVLTKWDGWDRHPLKQKSHSPAHTCADRRAPPNLSHTLQHVIYLMLIQPQHTHVTAALCPGQRIPNDFCFFPTISVSDYFSSVNVYADRPCHLTFISLSLRLSPEK